VVKIKFLQAVQCALWKGGLSFYSFVCRVFSSASTALSNRHFKQILACAGAVRVDAYHWRCSHCGFSGTFGNHDTVGAHMLQAQFHKQRRAEKEAQEKTEASGAPGSSRPPRVAVQQGIMAALAKAPKASYPPNPSVQSLPKEEVNAYIQKRRCHGFYQDTFTYGQTTYDISGLKQDLHPGGVWYAEPFYARTVMIGGETVRIDGTFRHVDCEGVNCSKCVTIPREEDFRNRVRREGAADIPRGERVAQQGIKLEYLNRTELIETSRFWYEAWKTADTSAYFLNIKVLNLQKVKVSISDKLQIALSADSLPELAEVMRRASDLGAFKQRQPLLDFLMDVGKNLTTVAVHEGKKQGKRYSESSKLIYETAWKFGGPLVHNFLSLNLEGPVLNTSKRLYRQEAFFYTGRIDEHVGLWMQAIYTRVKEELGHTGPVPFELSEDEAKAVPLATWNRRTNELEGFCGLKTEKPKDHSCNFDTLVHADSYESITSAFAKYKVGEMIRLIVANPLVKGFPRLVYAILCTCNAFDHKQIESDHQRLILIHEKYLGDTIGPLVAHASDGDSRRRKLQLESIARGTYGLDHVSFTMPAELTGLLRDQNFFHCGKKWRNVLLSAVRMIRWGETLATRNHLRLVFAHFDKSGHGLNETDIDVRDVQNVPAVQRLALVRVRTCLSTIQEGFTDPEGEFVQDDVRGTHTHLLVLWAYLDIFLGQSSLIERVRLASFVVHMMHFGSAYVLHAGHGLTLKENWLTRECATDMQMSCHFAVNLIRLFRDKFPELPCPLDRVGSDCCEDQFSMLGQETRNMHNFTFAEATERAAHCSNGTNEGEEGCPSFCKVAPSRESVASWWST
jgi:hypothetical protein